MFHAMLDAAGVVLRVHYKNMQCDILFSQGSVSTIFKLGVKKFPCYNSAKNIFKNRRRVMITYVLSPFYGSQCILVCPQYTQFCYTG